MPPARAWWAGIYAFVMTTGTSLVAQYSQLSGTQTRLALGTWGVSIIGGLMAAAGAIKAGWPETPPPPRTLREYPE